VSKDGANGLRDKFKKYTSTKDARSWLEKNIDRVQELFSSELIRDFIFWPFKGIFTFEGTVTEQRIRAVIAGTALANAVMAGLPGKLGIGVGVAIALEAYMAFQIARHVGYRLEKISDVWELLGVTAGAVLGIFMIFKQILGTFFSLFNLVGALPATFLAEFFATTLLGVIFWLAFEEGKKTNRFTVPRRLLVRAGKITGSIVKHQWSILRAALSVKTVNLVATRMKAFFLGELVVDRSLLRGDVFVPMSMASVLARQGQSTEGPLGELFVQSIYRTHPKLDGSSLEEIAQHMERLDPEALRGAMSLIKGDLFEQMVEIQENSDGDAWAAALHNDRNYPGSDVTFINEETGESIEVSLKATMNKSYVEDALRRYPDIPIQTTDEVAEMLEHTGAVQSSGIDHAEVAEITEGNFEELLEELPTFTEGAAIGVSVGAFAALYPFLVSRLRGRISDEQLQRAATRVSGQSAAALITQLLFAATFGPIYGWFLLARMSIKATAMADEHAKAHNARRRILIHSEDGWAGGELVAPA
jgi:hypothetical protein